jgi:FAD:protein FMN transferase
MTEIIEVNRSFRAMNTDVTGIIGTTEDNRFLAERALYRVELLFNIIEHTLSRFQIDSELCNLNKSGSSPFVASQMLFEVVNAGIESARITEGLFDPTILPNLLAAGYNCSFEKMPQERPPVIFDPSPRPNHWRQIRLNMKNHIIQLPDDCSLDLGGIGRGWAVDQACLILQCFPDFALDAGGEIRVHGRQVGNATWRVGVDDPFHPGIDMTTLHLTEGAICTSSTVNRRWIMDGKILHHLIDPRSGHPSKNGIIAVTVTADTAVLAEVLAKAMLIAGPKTGLQLMAKFPASRGLIVMENGEVLTFGREATCKLLEKSNLSTV